MIAVLGYEVRRSRVWEGNVERWLLKRQRANQQMRVLKRKFERVVVQSQKLSESTLEGKSVHLGGNGVLAQSSTSEGQEISGRFR